MHLRQWCLLHLLWEAAEPAYYKYMSPDENYAVVGITTIDGTDIEASVAFHETADETEPKQTPI